MTDDEIYGHLDFVVARPSIDEIRQGNFWRFDLVAILVSTRGLGVLEGKTEVDSQSFRTLTTMAAEALLERFESMHMDEELSADVVIIGGGVAGLTCSERVLRARPELQVLLLEWQDRLGGRLCSLKVGDVTADAGAAWVHGTDGNPLLLDGLLHKDILPSSGHNIWLHGAAGGDSCSFLRSPEDDLWERRLAQLGSAAGRAGVPGKSLQEGLRDTEATLGPLSEAEARRLRLLQLWFGTSAEEIGMLEWDSEHGSMGDYPGPHAVLKGGAESLAARLAADAKRRGVQVRFGEEVVHMREDPAGVVVHCRSGLRCRATWAVLTASLGVLKKLGPSFIDPAMPATVQRALSRLQMCHYNKILLAVTEKAAARFPVWTDIDSSYFWQLFNYWPLNGKALMSIASVIPEAQEMCDKEAQEVAEKLLGLLPGEVLAVHMTRWGQVEWALGSYSMSTKDAEWDDVRSLVSGMEGRRIRLAGEHTHEEHQGGFHAAYLSGIRAAEEALQGPSGRPGEGQGFLGLQAESGPCSSAMKNDDVSEGSRELVDLSAEAVSSLGIHLAQIGQIISKSQLPPNRGEKSSAHKLKNSLEMYQGYTDEVQRRRMELEQKMADDFARLKAWRAQSGTEGKGLVEELEALYGKVRQQDKEIKKKQQQIEEEQARVKELEEAVALRDRKWDSLAEDYGKKLAKMRKEIVERGGLCSWLQRLVRRSASGFARLTV
ncbi:LDL1 [Symbiodinium microadriaticum]|nr:LDL1 [Symbiodinium microadriaticum]